MILPARHMRRCVAAALTLALASALGIAPASAARSPRAAAEARLKKLPARVEISTGRLDPALAGLAAAEARGGVAGMRALAKARGLATREDRVGVLLEAKDGREAALASAVTGAGGEPVGRGPGVLQAFVPASGLARLASAEGVGRVRAPLRPRALETVSEGVAITAAGRWHTDGKQGAGVKVGIIDVGFKGYRDLMAAGELPASVETTIFNAMKYADVSLEGNPHGAAVAEVVHDMAPQASLYLAAVGDEADVAAAQRWMHTHGVKVVNMSLGFLGSPLDSGRTAGARNVVNDVVDQAVADGMFWANAAGNYRTNHWRGDFYDRDGDFALNWDGSRANLNVFTANGQPIEGVLWWRDSWTNAINDYDLLLLHYRDDLNDWEIVTIPHTKGAPIPGENVQWGRTGDQPTEYIEYKGAVVGEAYAWAIVNQRRWAQLATSQHRWLPPNSTRVDFDFFSPNQDIEIARPYRSIMTPADNESNGFMAVGAICATWTTGVFSGRPGFAQQEPYSSEGPNQNGVGTVEIAAPDDVGNATGRANGWGATFQGTSASSPHVAGAAALVLAANQGMTPAALETYLESRALGLGAPGFDHQTGAGALQLPATFGVDVSRIAGPDRYRTAIEVSKRSWASNEVTSVVLASGTEFPDALAGASLAGALRSPVLLTPPTATFPELLAEIARLTQGQTGPKTVHILGSEAAVGSQVRMDLEAAGYVVERHGGAGRFDTAAAIARQALDRKPSDTAFIVNGYGFADALAAAPVAYARGIPVLPVTKDAVPSAVMDVIGQRGITKFIIVGSTSVVSDAVQTRLDGLGSVERWQGAGRYDTMKDVVQKADAKGWIDFGHIGIASGANFPDALAGAAEAGRNDGPVLLTPPNILAAQPASLVETNRLETSRIRLYGAEPALQGAVQLGARMKADH